MFGRFMPTEGKFFEIFNSHAKYLVLISHEIELLIENIDKIEIYRKNIQILEQEADKLTHKVIDLLRKTFITPFDRDEIYKLITTMDDVIDLMEDVATAIFLYNIQSITSEASQLAHICSKTNNNLKNAISLLSNLKQSKKILNNCEEIDRLETEADAILHRAVSKLFREEHNVKSLIKLKAIYELLESITDKCKDVANIIQSIVLDHA